MSTPHKHQKSAASKSLDLNVLRPLLVSLITDGKVDEALDQVFKLLLALRDDNALMTFRLAKLLREKFGQNSEKISREQLEPVLINTGVSPLKTLCPLHPTPPSPMARKRMTLCPGRRCRSSPRRNRVSAPGVTRFRPSCPASGDAPSRPRRSRSAPPVALRSALLAFCVVSIQGRDARVSTGSIRGHRQ